MVQTPPLAIQLASMRLPEAIESPSLSVKFSKVKFAERENTYNNNLLLYPGEAEEILVSIENTSSTNLKCSIELLGDYSPEWLQPNHIDLRAARFMVMRYILTNRDACTTRILEYSLVPIPHFVTNSLINIPPNKKVNQSIKFKVDSDFFENQAALNEKAKLQIDYKVQIQVYLETPSRQKRIAEYQIFNLLIRPRTSYLDFLPSIFGEHDGGRRLVSIFEKAFDPVVQTTDVLWAYFDPLTAPEAFLPFLAQWVGWEIDKRWTVEQQRRLIRNAVTLYRWHGTKHGLRLYLHYYTDLPLDEDLEEESEKHISIEENFNGGFIVGKADVNKNPMLGGGKIYHFTVRLRTDESHQLDEELIREIIERYKPAFSTYELSIDSVHSAISL